jgi:Transcriptional regulator PadR-like family
LPALNAGQIYSTLARLDRDGLIVGRGVVGDSRGKRVCELTESGRAALAGWIETPARIERPRCRPPKMRGPSAVSACRPSLAVGGRRTTGESAAPAKSN